jgi:hypothetical protein
MLKRIPVKVVRPCAMIVSPRTAAGWTDERLEIQSLYRTDTRPDAQTQRHRRDGQREHSQDRRFREAIEAHGATLVYFHCTT